MDRKDKNIYQFDQSISKATTAEQTWQVLEALSLSLDGHKLFTITAVDMKAELARRLYSNHPVEYPVTGTKPIHRDAWFDIVHSQNRSFVANTIADISRHFPDYELIKSLGCGSVINLPVVLRSELVATVNLLHVEHHYSPECVQCIEVQLAIPAKLCCALASYFEIPDNG
jgi:hypothetical protein